MAWYFVGTISDDSPYSHLGGFRLWYDDAGLCSDAASFVTGHTVTVDGGYLAP
jgi:hypothetical protein